MENKELIDQTKLAESVANNIKFEFIDLFLVKALDPIKVKKEFSKPVPLTDKPVEKDGIKAVEYDEVETEIKEVDSTYRKGVVLKIPMSFKNMEKKPFEIKVGDVILFRDSAASYFDLLKDSKTISYYNIVAICE